MKEGTQIGCFLAVIKENVGEVYNVYFVNEVYEKINSLIIVTNSSTIDNDIEDRLVEVISEFSDIPKEEYIIIDTVTEKKLRNKLKYTFIIETDYSKKDVVFELNKLSNNLERIPIINRIGKVVYPIY